MVNARPRQFTDKEIKNLKPDTKEYWVRELPHQEIRPQIMHPATSALVPATRY